MEWKVISKVQKERKKENEGDLKIEEIERVLKGLRNKKRWTEYQRKSGSMMEKE